MLTGVTGLAFVSAPTVSAPAPSRTLPLTVFGSASSVMLAASSTATGALSVMVMSSVPLVGVSRSSVTVSGMWSTTDPFTFCSFGS